MMCVCVMSCVVSQQATDLVRFRMGSFQTSVGSGPNVNSVLKVIDVVWSVLSSRLGLGFGHWFILQFSSQRHWSLLCIYSVRHENEPKTSASSQGQTILFINSILSRLFSMLSISQGHIFLALLLESQSFMQSFSFLNFLTVFYDFYPQGKLARKRQKNKVNFLYIPGNARFLDSLARETFFLEILGVHALPLQGSFVNGAGFRQR